MDAPCCKGIVAGRPAAVWPMTLLMPRGTAVLPINFQSVPLLIRIWRPLSPAAMTVGVANARLELNGIAGKMTRSTTCSLSGSTMLTFSAPEFATYKVFPSGVRAMERGSWPTLMGVRNFCCRMSKTSTRFSPALAT